MAGARNIRPFDDIAVIYFSKEDGAWVAHSLKTDQVGIADSQVNALAQLIRLVHALCDEAESDPTVRVFEDAPAEVHAMAKKSKKLPGEIFEVAHRKAMGRWPEEWTVESDTDNQTSFVAEVRESACA
jgi:hypothetical protein